MAARAGRQGVFTEAEQLMDLQKRRHECRKRARGKLETVVKNMIHDETSLLDRLDRSFNRAFGRNQNQ